MFLLGVICPPPAALQGPTVVLDGEICRQHLSLWGSVHFGVFQALGAELWVPALSLERG